MRVTSVLGAQAVRLVHSEEVPEDKKLPLFPLIKALQDKYYFLQVPSKIEEFDFTKGVTFLGGRFENKAIDKFQVYKEGVLGESKTDTDHCDRFVEDVIKFGIEIGLPIGPHPKPDRGFFSSLEIHMEGDLGRFTQVSEITDLLLKKFMSYGQEPKTFSIDGFKMKSDPTAEKPPYPNEFVFERRAGISHASSLYASWGPLKTQDHIEVLTMIEKIMTS